MEVSSPDSTSSMQSDNRTDREDRAEETLWTVLGRLYRWKWFIAGVTAVVAVAAVVISLMLPDYYRASTRVLPPANTGGTSMLGSLSEGLPSAAQSLLGGETGEYTRLLALLDSRSMYESVVERFNLVKVYETDDSTTPLADAAGTLADNVSFVVDEEYNYMSVKVMDRDPQRAAKMANFFVERLNEMNARLASENAGNYRRFVEQRYREAEARFDSVMNATTAFQEKYGVMNLEEQASAFFDKAAQLRFRAIQAEIKYKQLRSEYGSANSRVQAARQTMQTANNKYEQAMEGQERMMPVAQEELPTAARQYAELEKERRILKKTLEYMRPLLGQARFDEQRQRQAVQVVDKATPPTQDAWPPRAIICIMSTLSAFMLAVLFVLVYEWWRGHHGYFARRLQAAVRREDEKTSG